MAAVGHADIPEYIFPYLLRSGMMSVGGAWKEFVVSGYVPFRGVVLQSRSLCTFTSTAAADARYDALRRKGIVAHRHTPDKPVRMGPLKRLADTKSRF